jgi:translation initiation factor 1
VRKRFVEKFTGAWSYREGGCSMKSKESREASLVYSSELGRMCPECGRRLSECVCRKVPASSAGDGIVRIRRESKGRGGKTVTIITGLPLDLDGIKLIAGELKRRCGTGGTIKDGNIEIQGDHREILLPELERRGFRVKRAGG